MFLHVSQENEGNCQISPNSNVMCESSSCKSIIYNFSNFKVALNIIKFK